MITERKKKTDDKKLKPIRLSPDQIEFIEFKLAENRGVSFQRYAISVLFPQGWEKELDKYRRNQRQ